MLEEMFLHQVRDHFGISLGAELVTFTDELLLEREIVLNNAVVHHDDLPCAIAMGMRIFFGGAAVRGPARVSDAVGALERRESHRFFEIAEFSFGAADLQSVAI